MSSPTRAPLALGVTLLAVLAIAVAGCGGGSDNNGSSSGGGAYGGGGGGSSKNASSGGAYGGGASKAASPGGAGAAVVSVAKNPKLGVSILVDSKGRTLYYFEKDKKGGSTSSCSGACASAWPPYTTSGTPTGQKGAQASMLGTIKRSDGSMEVTYNGWPLYTYAGDTQPGQANGNDLKQFGATWYALMPNGKKPPES